MQGCGGPGSKQGNPELIVRSDKEPPMLAFRDALIRELKERFGVRAIAQAPPQYDSASSGMVEKAIKQVKETRGAGLVCAFCWSDHSRAVKGADRLTAFLRAFQRVSHPRAREKILYLEASKKKVQITYKFLDGAFLGIKEGSEEVIVGTPAGCVVCRTVKRRPREDATDQVFFNSTRGTPKRLLPDDEPREPREPKEQPLRIDTRLVHTDHPRPINTKPVKPRRVYIRNSVLLARYGYTPGCIGCEAAMTHGPSHDHTKQCRT